MWNFTTSVAAKKSITLWSHFSLLDLGIRTYGIQLVMQGRVRTQARKAYTVYCIYEGRNSHNREIESTTIFTVFISQSRRASTTLTLTTYRTQHHHYRFRTTPPPLPLLPSQWNWNIRDRRWPTISLLVAILYLSETTSSNVHKSEGKLSTAIL